MSLPLSFWMLLVGKFWKNLLYKEEEKEWMKQETVEFSLFVKMFIFGGICRTIPKFLSEPHKQVLFCLLGLAEQGGAKGAGSSITNALAMCEDLSSIHRTHAEN